MSAALPDEGSVEVGCAGGEPASRRPHVSVVVPIYNVERYLTECLESLAQQTLRDLEVVMVDDGSTDSSARIAADFAASDDRFVLVSQPNGGLGNARNTGAARARGTYLAFVDSDDIVTEQAYERLAGTLDKTGSDFATGNFHRLTTTGTRQAGMVFTAFNAYRPRTHVSKHPALLNDRTAWNKLFRRTFWDRHGFRWPEGVLYEDIPVTIPAHVLAEAVDVVRQPVYLWRARSGDSSSITQRRVEPRAIDDRFTAVDGVSRFLASNGETALKALYDRSVAEQDFRYFLQHLDEGDGTFHERFLDLTNDFFDRAQPDVFDTLPAIQRLEWHLVRRRLLSDLLDVVRFENSGEVALTPFVRRGRKLYGDYPFRGDAALNVPAEIYRLGKDELPMPARVEDIWWDGDVLKLSGFAYIAFLPLASERAGRLRLTLEESGHPESVVPLEVRKVRRPDLTAAAPDGATNHDWSGWEASVPAAALQHRGRFRSGGWRLRVEARANGITRRRWVSATGPGRARRPEFLTIGGTRITPTTPAGHFSVQVSTEHGQVDHAEIDGNVLELRGVVFGRAFDPTAAALRVARADGTSSREVPVAIDVAHEGDGTPFIARLDLHRISQPGASEQDPTSGNLGDGGVWDFTLFPDGTGARVPLLARADLPEPGVDNETRELVVRVDKTGRVQLIERVHRPEVDHVARDGARGLVIGGRYAEPAGRRCELVLQEQDRAVAVPVPMTRDDGRFTVRLDPTALETPAGLVALSEGRWHFYARAVGDPTSTVRVKVARSALGSLPLDDDGSLPELTLLDVEERSLALLVGGDLPPGDQARAGQQRLRQTAYAGALRSALRDQVLVDGYGNGRYGEDVRALHEEIVARDLGLDVVWTTHDGLAEPPAGVRSVARYGTAWYEALARSRFVITTDLRDIGELAVRPDQTVLQTWHGIPVRPTGLDAPAGLGRDRQEHIRSEAARWDLVLSAGPGHSDLLRRAFDVRGSVVETGLPRHDVLVAPAQGDLRAARAGAARRRLGVPDGRQVVLFAPSYRPRHQVAPDQYQLDLRLDLDTVAGALGDDHVVLVRPHPKVVDTVQAADGRHVIDASWHPDVRDLLILADVLVTDCSSVLFDFALTGRPMVFFGGDPEHQEAGLGRPYLQQEMMPGRVVSTAEEVADAVRHAKDEAPDHAETYSRLLSTYLPRDDGGASARAVDALLSHEAARESPSPIHATPSEES